MFRKSSLLLLVLVATFPFCPKADASDSIHNELNANYNHKFVVVLRKGLVVGFRESGKYLNFGAEIHVDGTHAQVCPSKLSCFNTITQPAQTKEVLHVDYVFLDRKHSRFGFNLKTTSPHSIQRGIGAFAHESFEEGKLKLIFYSNVLDDYSAMVTEVDYWLKPFTTAAEAAVLGNTANGVFVQEVKLGMTFAEVEQALGLPQTRVDLGERVLYKYKDMTIEFRNGKVTDVR
jgi:hypothetical protein